MADETAEKQAEGDTTIKRAAAELKKARKRTKPNPRRVQEPPEVVRRAAVLHHMGYEQFLELHSEEDAAEIVKNRGCRINHNS